MQEPVNKPPDTGTAEPPAARNTFLLSPSMVALYAMVQLSAAISTVTFVAVTGASGLAGLGPAIFLTTAALMSYSVMVGMMTLAGYILLGHGHHQGAVFPVISAHFVGMFGLVLFVGGIIDRAGPRVASWAASFCWASRFWRSCGPWIAWP